MTIEKICVQKFLPEHISQINKINNSTGEHQFRLAAAFYSKKTYSFAITKAPFNHFNLLLCFCLCLCKPTIQSKKGTKNCYYFHFFCGYKKCAIL